MSHLQNLLVGLFIVPFMSTVSLILQLTTHIWAILPCYRLSWILHVSRFFYEHLSCADRSALENNVHAFLSDWNFVAVHADMFNTHCTVTLCLTMTWWMIHCWCSYLTDRLITRYSMCRMKTIDETERET